MGLLYIGVIIVLASIVAMMITEGLAQRQKLRDLQFLLKLLKD